MAAPPEQRLAIALSRGGGPLALAESCTGGLVCHRVTEVPGSSAFFDRGVVVYSNRAKIELLGVPESVLATHGAVSEPCARAMLEGLFQRTPAQLGAAVTGIAGPAGGTPEKPVGTVWVAWGHPRAIRAECLRLEGDRGRIKARAADEVLERLACLVGGGR